jgi:uncharacterized protein YsxB (DUF464 family)
VIVVTVDVDRDGMIKSATASGHAIGLEKGGNIVCAAATVLIRTAARLLEETPGVQVAGGPGKRGELSLFIEKVSEQSKSYVKAVGDYLLAGIRDLQYEFPDECTLEER